MLGSALVLAGCSNSDTAESTGKGFNDSDVSFAQDMIEHHAQALAMVDLTMGRDLDPEVAALTEDIRAAQAREIEQMTDWLNEWNEPVPETVRVHANAHGDASDMSDMDSDMPGIMSNEEMQSLEHAADADFQGMWLAMRRAAVRRQPGSRRLSRAD